MGHLIVLSGEAGAGKDSVAKVLVEEHGWELFSLAAPIKRFAADMFGFTNEQLYGPSSARNAPDPRWARPCDRCAFENVVPGKLRPPQNRGFTNWGRTDVCQKCHGTGKLDDNSPRRVLMLMGEEFLRQMIHVDVFTMRAAPEIEGLLKQGRKVVVNDARNDNDRDNLHAWLGAHRVDVRSVRTASKEKTGWRTHASENRQPTDEQVEYVIQNDEEWPFPGLAAQVATMLGHLDAG